MGGLTLDALKLRLWRFSICLTTDPIKNMTQVDPHMLMGRNCNIYNQLCAISWEGCLQRFDQSVEQVIQVNGSTTWSNSYMFPLDLVYATTYRNTNYFLLMTFALCTPAFHSPIAYQPAPLLWCIQKVYRVCKTILV
jgi:hypothetical protein